MMNINDPLKITPQWLAGFFDGEGCVSGNFRTDGGTSIGVSITQTDPIIIGYICSMFPGGNVIKREPNTGGFHRKSCFTIKWANGHAEAFLLFIRDHVILKNKQVELAIKFIPLVGSMGVNAPENIKTERANILKEIMEQNQGRII